MERMKEMREESQRGREDKDRTDMTGQRAGGN